MSWDVTRNLLGLPFTLRRIYHHHHHHHLTYCVVVFLHQCIYTLQHMSEDDSFYLVYIQNQFLKLPLHCKTHHMERFNHENLFLCLFSMFSTYRGRYCLLSVPSPVFQITETQPYPKFFYIEPSTLFLQRH